MKFELDRQKEKANIKKNGISFEKARTTFYMGGDMKALKILFFLLAISNFANADDNISKICVTGRSEATLPAQYSIIYTELKYVNKEMAKGYEELHQALSTVIDNLKKIGLSDKEITKSIVMQGSEKTWKSGSTVHEGYYSSCRMQLRINDMNQLPSIYNELAKYDHLTIQRTEYGRNDEFEKRNAEFQKALLAAKEKAKLMAKVLNAEMGPVFRIQEMSFQDVVTRNSYNNRGGAGFETTGGTFGSVDIVATVSVEFELKKP